ncbi:MAG: fibronectin type III domain-containing protein [bacterium]
MNLLISVSGTTVTVSWDANTESDLAGYKIYYGLFSRNDPAFDGYQFVVDVGNVTSRDLQIQPGKWYFAVTAYDTAGNESLFSEEVNAKILEQLQPPTGLETDIVNNRIRVRWLPVDGAIGYKIYVGSNSLDYGEPVDVGDVLFKIWNSLIPDQTYYFAVKAYDESGESEFSEEIIFQVEGKAPIAPAILFEDAGAEVDTFFVQNDSVGMPIPFGIQVVQPLLYEDFTVMPEGKITGYKFEYALGEDDWSILSTWNRTDQPEIEFNVQAGLYKLRVITLSQNFESVPSKEKYFKISAIEDKIFQFKLIPSFQR